MKTQIGATEPDFTPGLVNYPFPLINCLPPKKKVGESLKCLFGDVMCCFLYYMCNKIYWMEVLSSNPS